MQYFFNNKVTNDSNWRDLELCFQEGQTQGHEHIWLSRAQPYYNSNIRHCLYGLDADLIMLGLLSHVLHFCLLREEVKFGPASRENARFMLHTYPALKLCSLSICLALRSPISIYSTSCSCASTSTLNSTISNLLLHLTTSSRGY